MTDLESVLFKALKDLADVVECQPCIDGFEDELDAADKAIEQYKQDAA